MDYLHLTLRKMGSNELAIAWVDQALALDPENRTATRAKGLSYQALEKYSQAKIDLEVLEIESNNMDILPYEIDILDHLHRYDQVILMCDRMLSVDQNLINILKVKGVYTELFKYEEELKCCDRISQIDPNDKEALNNKGMAFFLLNQYENCIPLFNRALEIDPKYVLSLIE